MTRILTTRSKIIAPWSYDHGAFAEGMTRLSDRGRKDKRILFAQSVAATAAAVVRVAASAAIVVVRVAAARREQENEKNDPAAAVVTHVETTHNSASLNVFVETLAPLRSFPFHSTYYARR